MTGDLIPLFEGHNIRVLEKDSEPWFPLKDLADAWGLKSNTLYQIIVRNKFQSTYPHGVRLFL